MITSFELVAPGLPSVGYLTYVVCELLHRSGIYPVRSQRVALWVSLSLKEVVKKKMTTSLIMISLIVKQRYFANHFLFCLVLFCSVQDRTYWQWRSFGNLPTVNQASWIKHAPIEPLTTLSEIHLEFLWSLTCK